MFALIQDLPQRTVPIALLALRGIKQTTLMEAITVLTVAETIITVTITQAITITQELVKLAMALATLEHAINLT